MQTSSSIAILILAAGRSSRLGTPKQLLPYNGESLLRRTTRAAISVAGAETTILLGYEADRMKREIEDFPVRIVLNPLWEEGIASSIRTGIQSLPSSMTAALFLVCDQPHVTGELLQKIANASAVSGRQMVACKYGGTLGVPALFSRSLFDRLLLLRGHSGAQGILQENPDAVFPIPFPEGKIDIDTMKDLQDA
jgi:molybdenum cofactor cytidylyltransferase